MPVPSLPVEPVRADDPKKKEDEKPKDEDGKDASKDKEGEGEELVSVFKCGVNAELTFVVRGGFAAQK